MPNSLRRIRRATFVCLATVLAGFCLACGPSDPGSDEVRDALGGSRYVGPALADLPLEHECSFSDDFLPVIRCGKPSNERSLLRLDRELAVRVAAEPTDDQLRAKALVRLAPGPKVRDEAGRAVTLLEEALQDENDPQRRARLLADLAAAYLLWAEETQSPIEVVAGLEAALEAEELVPGLEDAVFNRRLALVLLGVDHAHDVADEPLLHDLAVHLAEAARGPEEPGCISVSEFGRRMDEWSLDPTEESLAWIREEASCWMQAEDRFVADVLAAGERDRRDLAKVWSAYRAAERALSQAGQGDLRDRLSELDRLSVPAPIWLATGYLRAMVPYLRGDLQTSESILQTQAGQAENRGYFGMAARAARGVALVVGLRGEHREAIEQNRRALKWAQKSGSVEMLAAVRDQQVELLERAGSEKRAWTVLTLVLRASAGPALEISRSRGLGSASRLARERAFDHTALSFRTASLSELGEATPPTIRIGTHLNRAELLWRMGSAEEARSEVDHARELFALADVGTKLLDRERVLRDIASLETLLVPNSEDRRRLLAEGHAWYRDRGFDFWLPQLELELARSEREAGDPTKATEVLRSALRRIEAEVEDAESWPLRTALVEAARPLIEELIDLHAAANQTSEVRAEMARYLRLRTAREAGGEAAMEAEFGTAGAVSLPPGVLRWTTFVLEEEVLHLTELGSSVELVRVRVSRERIADLRILLLTQLGSGAPENRLTVTLEILSKSLVKPIRDRLAGADWLQIVADDVLAGIPFALLPLSEGSGLLGRDLLVDHFDLSYVSNHRIISESPPPKRVLSLGADGEGAGLGRLERAVREAREVAALYPHSVLLTGEEATRADLLREFGNLARTPESDERQVAVHFAGHFVIDARSPLDSRFVLSGAGEQSWLSLGDFLPGEGGDGPDLLYLSACDTGRGLPPASHGFHSLAGVFGAAGVDRAVVTLWPLDDEMGARLALRFHERVVAGTEPTASLRAAQLEVRDSPLRTWGALALFH